MTVEAPQANSRFVSKVAEDSFGPAMNIPAVPAWVKWDGIGEFIASLGIDIDQLTNDGIHLGFESIECTVYAVNAKGRRYIDTGRRDADGNAAVAMHRISIPIVHPERDDER